MKLHMAIALCGLLSASAKAQNNLAFQIARPVGFGAAGTGLDASNRVYRAYPGIAYQIHADAVGGHWPYTYTLSGAPAGMTLPSAGTISTAARSSERSRCWSAGGVHPTNSSMASGARCLGMACTPDTRGGRSARYDSEL